MLESSVMKISPSLSSTIDVILFDVFIFNLTILFFCKFSNPFDRPRRPIIVIINGNVKTTDELNIYLYTGKSTAKIVNECSSIILFLLLCNLMMGYYFVLLEKEKDVPKDLY